MARGPYAVDELNIALDPSSPLSLQHQLRRKVIDAIHSGVLRPGRRLPSSRTLAERIGVSRNTVSLAYDALVAEGHLASRARSGVFVAATVPQPHGRRIASGVPAASVDSPLAARLAAPADDGDFHCPGNWHHYPFPFIDGRVDEELLPVAEWREALRLAAARHELHDWNRGGGDSDDPMLLEELRGKVLPVRGIDADADQLLVTVSVRHALQLVCDLLVRRGVPVLLEAPVDTQLESRLRERHADISLLDPELATPLPHGAVVVTSARRAFEAGSPWPRRLLDALANADGVLVEHDMPSAAVDGKRIAPALRALDTGGRVIHIGGPARIVSSGEPPGVITTEPAVIERLRQLRRQQGTTPPLQVQRSWAHFIGLGHYSAALSRASRLLRRRRTALRDALNHYLHDRASIRAFPGGSAYWLHVSGGVDLRAFARRAAAAGVLVEPARLEAGFDALCMGVTSLPEARIREGVRALSRLLRGDPATGPRRLAQETLAPLRGRSLRKAMSGLRLLYNTVYGEPCILELRANGAMAGVAGARGDDRDQGRWWIEGDLWCRQWQHWAYGEVAAFSVVIDGDQLRWYGSDGVLVDTAVVIRPRTGARRAAR